MKVRRAILEQQFLKKIDEEWERFYMLKLCTGSANIFASAQEIVWKQKIVFAVRDSAKSLSDEQLEKLFYYPDFCDEIYRYQASHPDKTALECAAIIIKRLSGQDELSSEK